MPPAPLLDANILVRLIARDHEDHLLRSQALFAAVGAGDQRVTISGTVIFETVYTLQQHYSFPRPFIRDTLLAILELEHVEVVEQVSYADVFDLFVNDKALSFADCYHAVLARELGGGAIISFDRGFDRIPGLTRIEPALPA